MRRSSPAAARFHSPLSGAASPDRSWQTRRYRIRRTLVKYHFRQKQGSTSPTASSKTRQRRASSKIVAENRSGFRLDAAAEPLQSRNQINFRAFVRFQRGYRGHLRPAGLAAERNAQLGAAAVGDEASRPDPGG